MQADSGRSDAKVGSKRNGHRFQIRTVTRTQVRSHLLKARAHGGAGTLHKRDEAARRNHRARHPSRQSFGTTRRIRLFGAESHLGSTLKPGGAVLTRGVSRRSGSVACIRADASPTEVLAGPSSHHHQCSSNMVGTNSHGRVARLDGMATTLQDPRVAETLDRMYTESREQMSLLRERRPTCPRPEPSRNAPTP